MNLSLHLATCPWAQFWHVLLMVFFAHLSYSPFLIRSCSSLGIELKRVSSSGESKERAFVFALALFELFRDRARDSSRRSFLFSRRLIMMLVNRMERHFQLTVSSHCELAWFRFLFSDHFELDQLFSLLLHAFLSMEARRPLGRGFAVSSGAFFMIFKSSL